MKRTLLALTLGGLLSSTGALASNVEVYGVLDYGLTWQQNDAVDGTSESSLKMLSGPASALKDPKTWATV